MEHTNATHTGESSFLLFDPIVVVRDVLKRWLAILLVALTLGVGAYLLTDMRYEPRYQTKVTFVVTNRGSSASVYSNLSSTSALASVFSELINSSVMRNNILQAMNADSFDGRISAAAIPETNLLTMTVTASDPRTAFLVAQAIIDHHEEVTYQVVNSVSLEVLQSAQVPTFPVNRSAAAENMKQTAIMAALAACAFFIFLSVMQDTVRSGREARKKLDCNYLGDIPHENKNKTLLSRIRHRKSGILITNPVTSFHFVENVRKLAHRVEQHIGSGKVLSVTSVMENEGKSTVAANIALTLARKGKKVLLIDCDLHKPAISTLLETKVPAATIRDVLLDHTKLSNALIRYKHSELYLILEKRGYANPGDPLASEQMQAILNWARREFSFVILDMPPMSAVSDAQSMTELVDATLLVVRQNTTRAAAINRAVAALESGKAKLLGCVLNDVHTTPLSTGQGYQYGSYGNYGNYGRYGKNPSRK